MEEGREKSAGTISDYHLAKIAIGSSEDVVVAVTEKTGQACRLIAEWVEEAGQGESRPGCESIRLHPGYWTHAAGGKTTGRGGGPSPQDTRKINCLIKGGMRDSKIASEGCCGSGQDWSWADGIGEDSIPTENRYHWGTIRVGRVIGGRITCVAIGRIGATALIPCSTIIDEQSVLIENSWIGRSDRALTRITIGQADHVIFHPTITGLSKPSVTPPPQHTSSPPRLARTN